MNNMSLCVVAKPSGFLFLAFLVFNLVSPAEALAQSFMGNYCWSATITDSTVTGQVIPTTLVIKTDIINIGSNASFTLIGYVTDLGDNPLTLSGSGQVIGSTLYLDLSGSQNHITGGWRDTSAIHAALDTSTYRGTFYDIGNDFNAITRVADGTRYSAGTIELLPACP